MHSPLSFCKTLPPTFSMVHLLHRLYGVDAPDWRPETKKNEKALRETQTLRALRHTARPLQTNRQDR